jgi:hypothetical protein
VPTADHHPGYHVWQAVRDHCQYDRCAHKNTQLAGIQVLAGRCNKLLEKLHADPDDELHRHQAHADA